MTQGRRRNVFIIIAMLASAWIITLLYPMSVQAEPVIVSDTFIAGTVGNSVVFTVNNKTSKRISGVRMTPQFPLQWSSITGITPQSATLEPGESIDFTIEFSIHKDAPNGALDSFTLFFDNDEDVKIDNPRYQVNLKIKTEEEKELTPFVAHFLILVRGSGYTFTPRDGTYEISGSEEEYFQVRRGENVREKLEDHKKYIEGDPCERIWAGRGGGEKQPPRLFTSGPQITIIEGPYYNYNEMTADRELKKDWKLNGKNGPHPVEMRRRAKCQ